MMIWKFAHDFKTSCVNTDANGYSENYEALRYRSKDVDEVGKAFWSSRLCYILKLFLEARQVGDNLHF